MVREGDGYVLYIEPQGLPSAEPVIDALTRKMAFAFRQAKLPPPERRWRGWHTCKCGANSTNCDYRLADGRLTNSLCVHYLAYHRDEVPRTELAKVAMLPHDEAEPTDEELCIPQGFRTRSL